MIPRPATGYQMVPREALAPRSRELCRETTPRLPAYRSTGVWCHERLAHTHSPRERMMGIESGSPLVLAARSILKPHMLAAGIERYGEALQVRP
jgi:hypothetical protein